MTRNVRCMPEPRMPFHMARNSVSSDQLLTMQQIADYIGKSYWYVRALNCGVEKSRKGFPVPDTKLRNSPLWKRSTIEAWWKGV